MGGLAPESESLGSGRHSEILPKTWGARSVRTALTRCGHGPQKNRKHRATVEGLPCLLCCWYLLFCDVLWPF